MDEKTLNKKLQGIASRFPKLELDREKEKDLLSRIVMSPGVYDGAPVLRNLEVPVEVVLGLLGAGHTETEVRNFLDLSGEDLRAVFLYVCSLVEERSQARNFLTRGEGEVGGISVR
jgi:uncharacterized protein (DUF433 family)